MSRYFVTLFSLGISVGVRMLAGGASLAWYQTISIIGNG